MGVSLVKTCLVDSSVLDWPAPILSETLSKGSELVYVSVQDYDMPKSRTVSTLELVRGRRYLA